METKEGEPAQIQLSSPPAAGNAGWMRTRQFKGMVAPFTPYILICLAAIVVHGLLLLNDGVYWDDWLLLTALRGGDWTRIRGLGLARGQPIDPYFQWFFSFFSNIEFVHRLVAFLSLVGIAALVYALCRKLGAFRRAESLWIALVTLAYPAFQTQILLSTTHYLFYYMLFLAAALLALRAEDASSWSRLLLRMLALLVFFVSFSLASLLVLYLGFLIILVSYARRLAQLSLMALLRRLLPSHLDYFVLPGLYWLIKTTWFPTSGLYANYNKLNFSSLGILGAIVGFWTNGIYGQFRGALLIILQQPLLWLVLLVGILAVGYWSRSNSAEPVMHRQNPFLLAGFGILVLTLAMLPYVLVGSAPSLTGWSTRHSLLLALPVGLIIMALTQPFLGYPRGWVSLAAWIPLIVLLVAFAASTVSTYLDWQARWVANRSLMRQLAHARGAADYSVYWVSNLYPLGGERETQFYEYASMFKQIWGGETRIGYEYRETGMLTYIQSHFSYGYNISGFDPAGCQADLKIRPGRPGFNQAELVFRYYYYKFVHPDRMDAFLSKVTRVAVTPHPSPLAVDCHQQAGAPEP